MKTLVLGVGAFGFAIINYLAKLHPHVEIYGYEKDESSSLFLQTERRHPVFFPGVLLEKNIVILPSIEEVIQDIELLIIAIPNQFIGSTFEKISTILPQGVIILNLSKGINNTTLETVSATLEGILPRASYEYAVLSGGMIASELVEGKTLGAQIGVSERNVGDKLREYFRSEMLHIEITEKYRNIELYGAIKNIFALSIGYLEGKGNGMSTVGYHFCILYKEMMSLIVDLGGDSDEDFAQYALGGDLIATCFGNSRNRYFGKLVGEGKTPLEAYDMLKSEKKHAEGYETLKGMKTFLQGKNQYPELRKIIDIFLP